jgi:hypothetical protein
MADLIPVRCNVAAAHAPHQFWWRHGQTAECGGRRAPAGGSLREALETAYETGWRDHEAGIRQRRTEVAEQHAARLEADNG